MLPLCPPAARPIGDVSNCRNRGGWRFLEHEEEAWGVPRSMPRAPRHRKRHRRSVRAHGRIGRWRGCLHRGSETETVPGTLLPQEVPSEESDGARAVGAARARLAATGRQRPQRPAAMAESPGPAEAQGDDPEELQSWVQCDRCQKWRRIPAVVAEALDDDSPWCGGRSALLRARGAARRGWRGEAATVRRQTQTRRCVCSRARRRHCEHNPNRPFASCSVAQELTNEEIDAGDDEEEVRGPRGARGWRGAALERETMSVSAV
jgi:hypothetical protein